MPYKLLNYEKTSPVLPIKPKSDENPQTGTNHIKKPLLMFLVHERTDSIGGVQRHSARLKEGLSNKYHIERYNWKAPRNRLPLNFPRLYINTKKNKPGLVYCDDGLSSIVGTRICKPLKKKVIATVHGLDIIVPLPGYQPIITRSLRKLDWVACVSRATAEQAIKRGVDPSRVEVIPNAAEIVTHRIEKNDALYDKIENESDIDLRGKKILFSLGRPLKRKGFDRFIEKVFYNLPEDYIYIAAGPKPSEPSWIKAAGMVFGPDLKTKLELALGVHTVHEKLLDLSNHPRVYYLNGVSEHLRNLLYAVADLFIMPNRSVEGDMEGFGIVALEAAVRGVPVIATGIEGIIDAVIDGRNGYCIAEGDDDAMARTIQALIDDPERLSSLAGDAREFTLKRFSIDTIVSKYERMFEEIMRESQDDVH